MTVDGESVQLQVREIAADVFGVAEESLDPERAFETIAAWDSLQHLNLQLDLEARFNVNLTPEESIRMTSVAATAGIILSHLS